MSKDKHKTIPSDKLASKPGLFRSRLTARELECRDADGELLGKFVIKPLDNAVMNLIHATADPYEAGLQMVAYGVVNVTGLTDEDGQPVKVQRDTVEILGRQYKPLKREWIERLDMELQAKLARAVLELCGLSPNERLRLDFTQPS